MKVSKYAIILSVLKFETKHYGIYTEICYCVGIFHCSFDCASFFFSRIVFHLMNQQHRGNRTVFTATHAKRTPKFKPIFEWTSKRMVLLAFTTDLLLVRV